MQNRLILPTLPNPCITNRIITWQKSIRLQRSWHAIARRRNCKDQSLCRFKKPPLHPALPVWRVTSLASYTLAISPGGALNSFYSSREVAAYYGTRVPCKPRVATGRWSGGAVEEYERHFSFLHISICSVWSVSPSQKWGLGLGGVTRRKHGTHLGLDRSGLFCSCVCWMRGTNCSVDWVLERIITVFFFRSVPWAGLHCSRAICSEKEMGFINTVKSTSGLGDLWAM